MWSEKFLVARVGRPIDFGPPGVACREYAGLCRTLGPMTLVDPDRTRAGTSGGGESGAGQGWQRTVTMGALTALTPLLLAIGLSTVAWVFDAGDTTAYSGAAGSGASLFLVMHGGAVGSGDASWSLVPLVLLAGCVWWAVRQCRRELDVATVTGRQVTIRSAERWRVAGLWAAGYVVVVLVGAALSWLGPAPVRPLGLVEALLLVPTVAVVSAVSGHAGAFTDSASELRRWIPDPVLRAVRPAVDGIAMTVGVGSLVVLLMIVWRWPEVTTIHGALGPGLVGGTVLTALQLTALPNLGLWAMSFLAGPGFQVIAGTETTWSGSAGGPMPLVPVFGALPAAGSYPVLVAGCVIVPIVIGGWIAHRALGRVARLSRLRTKAGVTVSAVALVALGTGLLDAVGGSGMGTHRLADVGAPALWLTAALALELLVGAIPVLVWDHWRLRR